MSKNRLHNSYCLLWGMVLHIGVMLHPTSVCKTNCPGRNMVITNICWCFSPFFQGWIMAKLLVSWNYLCTIVSNTVIYNHDVSSSEKWIIGSILYTTIPVSCEQPVTPCNGSIETYQNTTEGTEIFFRCNPGFIPAGRRTAVCGADGRWNTDPAGLVCTGEIFVHYNYRYTLNNVNS